MSEKTIEPISSESTAIEVFKPTPHMIVWLDTAIQMIGEPIEKIALESGIDPSTYYSWKKNPQWVDWYTEEYKKRRSRLIPQLDAIAMKYANKGSFSHLELLNAKAGDITIKSGPLVGIVAQGDDMSITIE